MNPNEICFIKIFRFCIYIFLFVFFPVIFGFILNLIFLSPEDEFYVDLNHLLIFTVPIGLILLFIHIISVLISYLYNKYQ